MKGKIKLFLISMILILSLTACESTDIESSFDIISELCKANFAPTTEEEYMEVFNKYKDTCIDERTLTTFFDIGKEVHTNVTMTDYSCKYYKKTDNDYSYYEACMHLSNGSVYTDIRVRFLVKDKKITNVTIYDNAAQ